MVRLVGRGRPERAEEVVRAAHLHRHGRRPPPRGHRALQGPEKVVSLAPHQRVALSAETVGDAAAPDWAGLLHGAAHHVVVGDRLTCVGQRRRDLRKEGRDHLSTLG